MGLSTNRTRTCGLQLLFDGVWRGLIIYRSKSHFVQTSVRRGYSFGGQAELERNSDEAKLFGSFQVYSVETEGSVPECSGEVKPSCRGFVPCLQCRDGGFGSGSQWFNSGAVFEGQVAALVVKSESLKWSNDRRGTAVNRRRR